MEPFNASRKKYVDTVLEPDLDKAVLSLAKSRKEQPLRCVQHVRETANNTIRYYANVHVTPAAEDVQNFTQQEIDKFFESGARELNVPGDLSTYKQVVMDSVSERAEMLSVQEQLLDTLQTKKKELPPMRPSRQANQGFVVLNVDMD